MQDFCTLCKQFHRHILAIKGSDMTDGEKSKAITALKADKVYSLACQPGPINQMYEVAKREGRIWDLICKILDGDCVPARGQKRFKPPTSAYPFTKMGALDDETVESLLLSVVRGELSVVDMRKVCDRKRALLRLKREIIDHMMAAFSLEPKRVGDEVQWSDVEQQFPGVGDEQFVGSWVDLVVKIKEKDPLPSQLIDAVEAIVDRQLVKEVMLLF